MSVKGVWKSGSFYGPPELYKMDQIADLPGPLSAVLAACHSLTFDPSTCEIVGDPLDRAIFISTNWVRWTGEFLPTQMLQIPKNCYSAFF